MSRIRRETTTKREAWALRRGIAVAATAFAGDLADGVLRGDTRSLRSIALDAAEAARDLMAVSRRCSRLRLRGGR